MEPKQTQIKKLVLTALFVAIATYGGVSFPFRSGSLSAHRSKAWSTS